MVEAAKLTLVPAGDEEAEWLAHENRRHSRMFALSEIAVLAFGVLVPLAGTLRLPSIDVRRNAAEVEARRERETLARSFEAEPANREVAYAFIWALRRAGEAETAQEALTRHEQARRVVEDKRESLLRARFGEAKAWEAAEQLIILYDEQGRTDDARKVWEEYAVADTGALTQASYGIWLYQNGLPQDAVAMLHRAIAAGLKGGEAEAYLGLSLAQLGDKAGARRAMRQAIAKDSAWREELQPRIDALAAELKAEQGTHKPR
ncbi:MAG: hypothetical protein HYZ27_10595 [Deltaproteobacteria bacterium]|nr:hypothetical protein [Deltaproteobacteria bacterium]